MLWRSRVKFCNQKATIHHATKNYTTIISVTHRTSLKDMKTGQSSVHHFAIGYPWILTLKLFIEADQELDDEIESAGT